MKYKTLHYMHTLTPPFTLHCATQTVQILSRTLGFPDPIDVNSSLGLTFEIQIARDNSHLLLSSRQLSIIVHNEYPILTMENFNHNESLVCYIVRWEFQEIYGEVLLEWNSGLPLEM